MIFIKIMKKICKINQAFKSRHIYTAKLKKKLPFVPIEIKKGVFISELDNSDRYRLLDEKDKWTNTTMGENIINDYFAELRGKNADKFLFSRYYIVEDLKDNIKGFALLNIREGVVELSLLQSEREKKGNNYSMRGVGTCLLYATSKLAQNLKMNCVSIKSRDEAIDFYKKAGAQQITNNDFIIKKTDFNKFQQNIEKKYSINQIC